MDNICFDRILNLNLKKFYAKNHIFRRKNELKKIWLSICFNLCVRFQILVNVTSLLNFFKIGTNILEISWSEKSMTYTHTSEYWLETSNLCFLDESVRLECFLYEEAKWQKRRGENFWWLKKYCRTTLASKIEFDVMLIIFEFMEIGQSSKKNDQNVVKRKEKLYIKFF